MAASLFVIFHLYPAMWPEGPRQRLPRCPKATGGDYIHFSKKTYPRPGVAYHTALAWLPFSFPPSMAASGLEKLGFGISVAVGLRNTFMQ